MLIHSAVYENMSITIHRNYQQAQKSTQRDEQQDTKAIHTRKHPITVAYWSPLLWQQKLNQTACGSNNTTLKT